MNSQEAKTILAHYRPGRADEGDAQLSEALEQTQRDPELRQWFERSSAVQMALRQKFRELPVPPDLEARILAMDKMVRPGGWQGRAWLAAAAAIALLFGLSVVWLQPRPRDRFSDYRSRMVRSALRQYQMDIVTNDLAQVRHYLAQRGTPADYVVTNGLEKLSVTGGGCLDWRGHPVSMVCFDRGDKQMLFLFVIARAAVKDAPATATVPAKVNKLRTTAWSEGDKTYLLAGPEDSALLR